MKAKIVLNIKDKNDLLNKAIENIDTQAIQVVIGNLNNEYVNKISEMISGTEIMVLFIDLNQLEFEDTNLKYMEKILAVISMLESLVTKDMCITAEDNEICNKELDETNFLTLINSDLFSEALIPNLD